MPSFFVYFSVVLPALSPHMLQVWSGAYLRVEIEGFENSFSNARSSFCITAKDRESQATQKTIMRGNYEKVPESILVPHCICNCQSMGSL